MIKAKPASNLKPVYFEWDKGFKVQIRDVPQARRSELIKSNEETTWNAKHQKSSETNWLRFADDYMREAIVGWEGLTYRILLEICQPFDLEPGVKLDDEIEFSKENLEYIVKNRRPEFLQFMGHANDRLTDIYAEQKRKELENL